MPERRRQRSTRLDSELTAPLLDGLDEASWIRDHTGFAMAGSRKGFRYPPYELILVVGESPHKTVDGELRGSFKPIRVYDARLAPSWRMVGSPSELVVKTLDQFFDVLGPLPTNTPLTSSRSGRSIVNPETLFAMADWAKEHEPVPDGLLLFRNNIGIGSEQLKAMAERVEAWTKLHPDQDFSLS